MLRASFSAAAALTALLLAAPVRAQTGGEVAGRVTEAGTSLPVAGATVLVVGTNYGTAAGADGTYRLRIAEGRYALSFRAVGYAPRTDSVTVRRRQVLTLNVTLAAVDVEVSGQEVIGDREEAVGVTAVDPRTAENIPNPLNDVMAAPKVFLGVTSNDETSNAYSVRGGGYNENLYFLDGFEVYRPFRTTQGEQEGLGLINGDLASAITLYAGGFPARYGGKLASALDITYGRPTGPLTGSAYTSTLDAGAVLRAGALNDRLGVAVAARTARASSFFGSKELKGVYEPDFRDAQGVVDLDLADGHAVRAIGLLARHRFRLEPSQRRTTFGVFPDNIQTVAEDYTGERTSGYDVRFAALRLSDRLAPWLRVEHEASFFETDEVERDSVLGGVILSGVIDVNEDPLDPANQIEQGSAQQFDFADNQIRVATLTGGGSYRLALGRLPGGPHAVEAGWQLRRLQFRDRLFEVYTLAGQDAATGEPLAFTADSLNDAVDVTTGQASLWLEDAAELMGGRLVVAAGVRADHFAFNDEWTVSPRLSARYRLSEQTTFSGALGTYYQAPTYRELRGEPLPGANRLPALNTGLRSQRADLLTFGAEHFFTSVRFGLRGEAWYKRLSDLISYEVENVRVLYSGVNDSEGYAYGLDVQLRGEFVPGLESWVNYGFLQTREGFLPAFVDGTRNDGSIPRPTDRRHNFAMFVQDHVPGDDSWTLHMRALFGTGTPFTPPALDLERIEEGVVFERGPRASLRYPEYFRFDMGASKTARLGTVGGRALALRATAEVLNVFDMKNTISYSWVTRTRPGVGRFFEGVPTRLTPRTVNVRLRLDF